jgi:hypothetical protein
VHANSFGRSFLAQPRLMPPRRYPTTELAGRRQLRPPLAFGRSPC